MICFYDEDLLTPLPTPNLEDHRLSAVRDCLFNIYQLPSTLEAFPPSGTWGCAMPWWQGPTYHRMGSLTVPNNCKTHKQIFIFINPKSTYWIILDHFKLDHRQTSSTFRGCSLQVRKTCMKVVYMGVYVYFTLRFWNVRLHTFIKHCFAATWMYSCMRDAKALKSSRYFLRYFWPIHKKRQCHS